MTIAELIAELQKLPPNAQVIIQKDAEGNGHSPLNSISADYTYIPESTWSGEVVWLGEQWDETDYESEEEWEKYKATVDRCCVLFPVN